MRCPFPISASASTANTALPIKVAWIEMPSSRKPPTTAPSRIEAWIAAGFEIVHSVFPGWRFRAPDCTAQLGLHGKLVVGPRRTVGEDERDALFALLPVFEVTLRKDGAVEDTGVGANVLDSPAHALAHLRDVLSSQPLSPPLRAGEIVTTGTITDAMPVAAGETWTSDYGALPVRGLTVTIAGVAATPSPKAAA